MTWQPIDTAPKDGTEILTINIRHEAFPCEVVWWESGGWTEGTQSIKSTHWMPLPAPPT